MESIEQLFIRACKSKDPHKRVRSVYRRFYLVSYGFCEDHTVDIASILTAIADRYMTTNRSEMVNLLAPQTLFPRRDRDSYWDRVVNVMVSQLRLAPAARFPGYIPPAKLRKEEDK